MENSLILSTLVEHAESSAEATLDARIKSQRDRDYYDNNQWTAEEISELEARGQPIITLNRIKPKVDFLLGNEIATRTDPKAYPRTPMHAEDADAVTDALRYACDKTKYLGKKSEVAKNLACEGTGAFSITGKQSKDGYEIVVNHIPWDRFYYDPASRAKDFSDAKWLGFMQWMDEDDVIAMAGERGEKLVEACHNDRSTDEIYQDRPSFWVDRKRKRIRVSQEYFQHKGKWYHAIYTKAGFIVEPGPSPYVNEHDEPVCCIVAGSAHVDKDGNRYGPIRQLIGPQDEINKRRSKALHLMSSRQIVTERGSTDGIEAVRKELHKPDGVLEVNPGARFEIMPNDALAAAQLGMMQEAKSEIDTIGANAALTGSTNKSLSGRAVQALQQGGQMELAPFFDALKDMELRCYEQIWYRIRQFWTWPMWIRVTDDEANMKWVGLNQPYTLGQQILDQERKAGAQITPEQEQFMMSRPGAQMQVGVKNQVSNLEVDIIIDRAPDTITIQQEQFQVLAELAPQAGAMPPQMFEMLIEASALRNKRQILDKLKGKGEEQQIPPQIQQQMQQMQQLIEAGAAEYQKLEAEHQKLQQQHQEMAMNAEVKAGEIMVKHGEIELKGQELQVKKGELLLKQQEMQQRLVVDVAQAEADKVAAQADMLKAQADMVETISQFEQSVIGAIQPINERLSAIEQRKPRKTGSAKKLPDGTWQLMVTEDLE